MAHLGTSIRWARLIAQMFGHGHRAVRIGGCQFEVAEERVLADSWSDMESGRTTMESRHGEWRLQIERAPAVWGGATLAVCNRLMCKVAMLMENGQCSLMLHPQTSAASRMCRACRDVLDHCHHRIISTTID